MNTLYTYAYKHTHAYSTYIHKGKHNDIQTQKILTLSLYNSNKIFSEGNIIYLSSGKICNKYKQVQK